MDSPRLLILVVVPVLDRPANVQPLVDSWEAATEGRSRLLFVVTETDIAERSAITNAGVQLEDRRTAGWRNVGRTVVKWRPGRGDFAKKVNHAYRITHDEYLFQAADDVRFHKGWETAVLERVGDFGVVGTNDRANPKVIAGEHSTHSLIARWYVDECGASWDGPGSVFSESYSHQYVDTELVELAKHRGCYTHAHDAVVEHLHPMWRTAERDATYDRGLDHHAAQRDFDLFTRREAEWRSS